MCQQQTWGRKYWSVLRDTANEELLQKCGHCPASTSGYQLFRQQALAQGIANVGLFDYVISGVAYDSRNAALVNCLKRIGIDNFVIGWPQLFNTDVWFHCFTHQDLVSYVKQSNDRLCQKWIKYVTDRYSYR